MYLPPSLSIPQQSIFAQTFAWRHFASGGNAGTDDYFTAIWGWILKAGAVIASWFKNVFASVVDWIRETWPSVASWFKNVFAFAVDWIRETWPIVAAWIVEAATSASELVKAHPHVVLLTSAFIFLGPQILLLPLFILQAIALLVLTALGFGARGIVGGSPAARYQSLCYGGNTPASSLFAILQSIGMKYHAMTLGNWVLAFIRLVAGVLFVYVVLGMTLWW
ncbi:hypothetical protein B0H16DRAFT_96527 [Mycena metata]|uniref:Uncharacterized protein n=1 Tax=Mycena metata TaxID=1033252 RepID=A0AAD7MYY6_9AGAR|nr:hypothetical protein B0H16DRAFT_96527 [Mycena metata]